MTGNKKEVIAFVKECHANIYLAGCSLHHIQIVAKHGANFLPIVDELLNIYSLK